MMPKLPDIEYAVVSQGPPSTAQAWGAAAQAMAQLGQIGHQATMAFAEEQAKTQMSEASLVFEQGLADTEAKLASKPYLTPAEVKSAFPGGAPPEVATILERHQDENAPSVPTHEVGTFIHSEVAKRLGAEATPLIYSQKARAEFERRMEAEGQRRNARVTMAMLSQGAELNAAKAITIWEQTLNALPAATDAESNAAWSKLRADISTSGLISPAKKLELLAKVDEAKAARPVYDAIQSNDPAAIQAAMVSLDTPEASEAINVAHRASYRRMLSTALDGIDREREQAAARAEHEAGVAALNGVASLRQEQLSGRRVPASRWLSVVPPIGSVDPKTMEHIQNVVADAMKPKELQVKTNLGVWAIVEQSRVNHPEEWAQGTIVLPDGKKTNVLALQAGGGLSMDDAKSLIAKQADAAAKPDQASPFALQKTDQDEIGRLLEFQYKFNTTKVGDKWAVPENEKIVGWMYKVVESDLAAAARQKQGGRLTIDERTAVIRKTLAREVKSNKWSFGPFSGGGNVVENVSDVPPDFQSAYRSLPLMPGKNVAAQDIAKTYKAFTEKYQAGADAAWAEMTKGAPFTARDAAIVSVIVETRRAEIDAELKRVNRFNPTQDAANDPLRAALAVRFYLAGAKRRR